MSSQNLLTNGLTMTSEISENWYESDAALDNLERRINAVLARRDAAEFAELCSIIPDPWQAELLRATEREIMLNCARQSGKSTITAILALHQAIYFAGSLVLLCSPSLRQSQELFRKVKERYRALERQPSIAEESGLRVEFENGSRVICLPGREETIRGFSDVALLIMDEAARVPDELYNAMRPVLAVSGGRLILLSTPFGKRGFFFEEWTHGGDRWRRFEVRARECPRISAEFLETEKKSLPDLWYRSEYLCEFVEAIDAVFSYETVMGALSSEVEPLFGSALMPLNGIPEEVAITA